MYNFVGYMAVPASFHLVKCQFFPKHNSSQKIHCYIFPISVQNKELISDLDFKESVNSHITGSLCIPMALKSFHFLLSWLVS